MKIKYLKLSSLMLAILLVIISCGSKVENGGGSNDISFDPSKSMSLKVWGYKGLQDQLIVSLGLDANNSSAISFLDDNLTVFDRSARQYDSLYGNYRYKLMSQACGEIDYAVFFPNGEKKIDTIWKKMTGALADSRAKQIEADMLKAATGQPDDVVFATLCLGAAMSADASFYNFVAGSN